jgi:hypothetical protein
MAHGVTSQPVVTENSVRAENAEVPSIHEILVVSMSSLFVVAQ